MAEDTRPALLVHKTANVLNKLPKSQQSKAKRALQEIWIAETKKDALAAFDAFIETWGVKYDKAVECLIKDRDALLAGVLFGDVLTMVQWAAIAGIPNEVGSLWRCLAVAGAGVAISTTTLWLLPDPSWTNRGIVAASCALPGYPRVGHVVALASA